MRESDEVGRTAERAVGQDIVREKETGGGVSEFGGFFFKTRAKSIDIVSEGVYYSGIIDEKAPETVPFALDGDRTSAADVFMRETRGEFCMRGREMKWRYLEQLFSFQI